MSRLHPLGRVGTPGEVAGVIAALLSDDFGFVSGASSRSTAGERRKVLIRKRPAEARNPARRMAGIKKDLR